MNRMEYIAQLEKLLQGMPDEERQAAVQYYVDYFADAGEEKEADVIRELGSPEKVAESIKADYYGTQFNEEDFEHKDYMDKYTRVSGRQASGNRGDNAGYRENYTGCRGGDPGYRGAGNAGPGNAGPGNAGPQMHQTSRKPWNDDRIKILLIVLIAVVLWPVTLAVGAVVLAVVTVAVGFFAGLVLTSLGILFAGGIVCVVGAALLVIPPAAFVVIGTGLLIGVAGLAATAGTVKLCTIVYPAMLRGFVNLCRRPFYGKAV